MTRISFERAKEEGDELDQSVAPIYLEHTVVLLTVYALAGTREAALHKFAIRTTQSVAGRSSEAAFMTICGLEWDPHFKGLFGELPQSKPGKMKWTCFLPGAHRHACWFLQWADYLVLHQEFHAPSEDDDEEDYGDDGRTWLIPELHKSKTPGTTLGRWMKAFKSCLSCAATKC